MSKNKTKFFPIHGGINSGKSKDIIQEVGGIHNSGKVEGIDFTLDDVNFLYFPDNAKFVTSLSSIGIRKKVTAISNLSIGALSILGIAPVGSRRIPEYLEIDFKIPEEDSGLDEEQLKNLYLRYAQMMKSLQNENFSEETMIEYMKSRKRINGQTAKSLGIVGRSRVKGSRSGTLVSAVPVDTAGKETDSDNQQGKEE